MDYNNMNNWHSDRDRGSRSGNYGFGFDGGGDGRDEIVSVSTWIGIFIVLAIPFVNFIAMLVMAFSDINKNIKNYAKASLVMIVISFVFVLFFKGCAG